ncbi:hypothetical protein [[Clostridium] polysaccharolyticum]|uniref:Uncharacterized protein n=1 Tax=[Clostridium] polysaccharolyticum TaxID=29364 RepID=A0A1H9Y625_9FIRM|nr:hypothetical protein [[Clostridium] polysaccharolyticum]SES64333.1 hypothetical protein SAMN04487772_101163 [[Clostridium] polysaccharolyticum]
MKSKIFMKRMISLFLVVIISIVLIPTGRVEASIKNESYYNSSDIGKDVFDYVNYISSELINNVVGNEQMYGVVINNYANLHLGEPFTIFDLEKMQKLDEVYYFPIMEGKEVRLIISVYKVGENWNATIAKGFSDELNSLECANFLMFRKKGMIYAELETGRKVIFEDKWLNEESSEMVTLYGYSDGDKSKTITYWNSANEQVQTATYNQGPVFATISYGGYPFSWVESVY